MTSVAVLLALYPSCAQSWSCWSCITLTLLLLLLLLSVVPVFDVSSGHSQSCCFGSSMHAQGISWARADAVWGACLCQSGDNLM